MIISELEQLQEYSLIDQGIQDSLEDRGYRLLGTGIDQEAYETPDPRVVLKIFGTWTGRQPGGRPGAKFQPTPSQQMFLMWADYCRRHENNPFLPRFYRGQGGRPWAPFVFKGRVYLQIWQERLKEGGALENMLSDIGRIVEYVDVADLMAFVRGQKPLSQDDEFFLESSGMRKMKTLAQRMGDQNLELFLNTLADLYKVVKKHGWHGGHLDMHRGNIMRRADGTPVITDPWHVG